MKTFKQFMGLCEKYVALSKTKYSQTNYSIYKNPSPSEYASIIEETEKELGAFPKNFRFIIDHDGKGDLYAFSYKLFHADAIDSFRAGLHENGNWAVFGEFDGKKRTAEIYYYNSEVTARQTVHDKVEKNIYLSRMVKSSYRVRWKS